MSGLLPASLPGFCTTWPLTLAPACRHGKQGPADLGWGIGQEPEEAISAGQWVQLDKQVRTSALREGAVRVPGETLAQGNLERSYGPSDRPAVSGDLLR